MKIKALLLLIFLWTTPAFSFVVTEFGAVNMTWPTYSTAQDPSLFASPGFGVGGGITLSYRIWENLDIEPGILYIGRVFNTYSSQTGAGGVSFSTGQIPLLLRYWFNRSYSVGLGGYWAHGFGNITKNSSLTGFPNLSWSYEDFGIQASFRYLTPISTMLNFVFDGRVNFGFTAIDSTSGNNLQFRELQTWVGLAVVI